MMSTRDEKIDQGRTYEIPGNGQNSIWQDRGLLAERQGLPSVISPKGELHANQCFFRFALFQQNAQNLNFAYKIAPLQSKAELKVLVNECHQYNERQMRKDKLLAQLMDRGMSPPIPGWFKSKRRGLKNLISVMIQSFLAQCPAMFSVTVSASPCI